MTYAKLMAKLKRGEALTAEEVAALEKESRPAERFNEVSAKAQKFEADLKAKEKEFEELSNKQLDEAQRLQDEVNKQLAELSGKVETLSANNQELQKQAESAQRAIRVRDLANTNPTGAIFNDPKYLGFLLSEQEVDLDNEEQVKSVFETLKETHPEQFKVPVTGGSGAGQGNQTGGKQAPKSIAYDDFAARKKFIDEGGNPEDFVQRFTPLDTKDN